MGELEILLECKTCTKSPPLIKKEEAWAVLQKSADYDKAMARVTLGKPMFDEVSKKKAAASQDITLIEHSIFVEGLLRVHGGSLEAGEFWLGSLRQAYLILIVLAVRLHLLGSGMARVLALSSGAARGCRHSPMA